jgi:phosphate acetyltransferase
MRPRPRGRRSQRRHVGCPFLRVEAVSRNLYVTINEPSSGKSAISLGLMELLSGTILRVGFFRPIARIHEERWPTDPNIELIRSHFRLEDDPETMYGVSA